MRTLVGGGSATLPPTLQQLFANGAAHVDTRTARFGSRSPADGSTRVVVRDDVFIAEPQVNMLWNLTWCYRFSVGVGYRLIGAAPLLGKDVEGVSASVAFQTGK